MSNSGVLLQPLADLALGTFLSGGVDSSTIVALMQHQVRRLVKPFPLMFVEPGFDELPHSIAVAQHLSASHV